MDIKNNHSMIAIPVMTQWPEFASGKSAQLFKKFPWSLLSIRYEKDI